VTIKRKWVNGDEQTTMEEAIEECLKPDEKPEPEPDKYAEPVSIKPQPKRDTDHHFWKQRLLTREKVLQDIVKASKPSQVRVFIELIVMIVLIYLMLRDMYFDGRLNFILEWLGISPVTP
jgi:hypothetical protein